MKAFFTWYWALWILAFLVPEVYWLVTNSDGTLSFSAWSMEDLNMRQPFDFPMWTATHWAVAVARTILLGAVALVVVTAVAAAIIWVLPLIAAPAG